MNTGELEKARILNVQQIRPKIKVMYEALQPSINEVEITKDQTEFIEFLKVNLQISVIACVDLTASNIHQPNRISLHQYDEEQPNLYQQAISSVCSVLGNYDSDKLIPIYGFGANIQEPDFDFLDEVVKNGQKTYFASTTPTKQQMIENSKKRQSLYPQELGLSQMNFKDDNLQFLNQKDPEMNPKKNSDNIDDRKKRISHFFPLSGKWKNCAGQGIDGVFKIYSSFLERKGIIMSGPTLFAPMLEEINKFAQEKFKENPLNYTVLLVLTDGVIHDMDDTIEQIISGSNLALSIIIVGIGPEDFQFMKILDSDNYALRDKKGREAARDIVQFVDYSMHQLIKTSDQKEEHEFPQKQKQFQRKSNRAKTVINVKNINLLSEEVLKELPQQVCGFYKMKGIKAEQFKKDTFLNIQNDTQIKKKEFIDDLRSIEEIDETKSLSHHSPSNTGYSKINQDFNNDEEQESVGLETMRNDGLNIREFKVNRMITSLNEKFTKIQKPKTKIVRFSEFD